MVTDVTGTKRRLSVPKIFNLCFEIILEHSIKLKELN
jgi:hypothetical protein